MSIVVGAWQECSGATGVNGDSADNSAYRSGAAYVFRRAADVWGLQAYLKASDTDRSEYFGFSVAAGGGSAFAGARCKSSLGTEKHGAVYVFE